MKQANISQMKPSAVSELTEAERQDMRVQHDLERSARHLRALVSAGYPEADIKAAADKLRPWSAALTDEELALIG